MPNTIAYQTLLAEALDKVLTPQLKTGDMEANASGIKYNGGNKFKFAKIDMDDIGDYNRNTGFTQGAVTLEYEEKEFKYDWGKSFLIDAMDVDETNFITTATNVLGEFERTKVVPKIDKTRMAELATYVPAGNKVSTAPTAANIYSQILTGISAITGETGLTEQDLEVYINHTSYDLLSKSTEIQKVLNIGGSPNSINTKVNDINGAVIKEMPDSYMKTKDATPKDIRFIVAYKKAPIAIVKHDKVRIFDPDTNQNADAWKIDVRVYHTLEVKDNDAAGLYANISA